MLAIAKSRGLYPKKVLALTFAPASINVFAILSWLTLSASVRGVNPLQLLLISAPVGYLFLWLTNEGHVNQKVKPFIQRAFS